MQQPVGHDQRADSTAMLRQPRTKAGHFCHAHLSYILFSYRGISKVDVIYLKTESYNSGLQSQNLVHKGVDFRVQNALKLTYERL